MDSRVHLEKGETGGRTSVNWVTWLYSRKDPSLVNQLGIGITYTANSRLDVHVKGSGQSKAGADRRFGTDMDAGSHTLITTLVFPPLSELWEPLGHS